MVLVGVWVGVEVFLGGGDGVGTKVTFVSMFWSVTTTSFFCVNPQAEIKNIEKNKMDILNKYGNLIFK
jgi:hypothetical protein